MTTCHGCHRPLEDLAQIRTYHSGCDPMGRVDLLVRVLRELTEAIDEQLDDGDLSVAIDPTERFVQAMRDAKAWIEYQPAQR